MGVGLGGWLGTAWSCCVHVIASEIRNGAHGNCRMLVDAECPERYQAFPRAFLPSHLQSSRPDIILFVGNDLPQQQQHSYISARTRRDAVVHLVEAGVYFRHEGA